LGFKPPVYADTDDLQHISLFERTHIISVFGKMSILEYERRLKKLVNIDPENEENNNRITEKQLVEVFLDHRYFKDLAVPDSPLRKFLLDPIFKQHVDDEDYYIPYLMLLGMLYCASNPKANADKFYDLI
jgi:hypothetical protein